MKDSIRNKLEHLCDRFEELGKLLSDPDVIADSDRFRDLSVEYARLEPLARDYRAYQQVMAESESAASLRDEADRDLREMAAQELEALQTRQSELELALQKQLIPRDPRDDNNVFLEIRAGTGGDEAALFAGDLFRMYCRYAEQMGWQVEVLSRSEGEHGGYKEVISQVSGRGAYARLKFESGTHRVQRVPATESQGRIHTSACTVAVLPEIDEIDAVEVRDTDLRVDTYRASGAGGQHVNKTDSAVRITHLPSGIVVECQDERSQHKNRARAMSLLRARLLTAEQEKQAAEQARTRKLQVGSGDRSERIRTYNYPQGRVTDHRINLTLYKLDDIVAGNLAHLIEPLRNEYQAEQLAELAN